MRDDATAQWLISTCVYPPTHDYSLENLEPHGVLKERFEILTALDKNFFQVENFLDVGSNKGFFSLYAANSGAKVSSIEPDKQFHDLLMQINVPKITNYFGTFKTFPTKDQFDSIWIGNTYHYIERECPGYQWVVKLAAITKFGGVVIIEGPTENSPDVPVDLLGSINEIMFIQAMSPFFTLLAVTESPLYTPGRKFWKFTRNTPNIFKLSEIKPQQILKNTEKDSNNNLKMEIIQSNDLIIKTPNRELLGEELISLVVSSNLESTMTRPIGMVSNPDGQLIGWVEPYDEQAAHETLRHRGILQEESRNKLEILISFLKRTIELAKIGFVDIDSGPSNWIKFDNNYGNFDKNSCFDVSSLNILAIKNAHIVFSNNYDIDFGDKIGKDFISALLTRDPSILEEWAKFELRKLLAVKIEDISSPHISKSEKIKFKLKKAKKKVFNLKNRLISKLVPRK
jgi:hypothetical protein